MSDYRLAFLSAEEAYYYWDVIGPLLRRAVHEADGEIDECAVLDGIADSVYRIAVMLRDEQIVLAVAVRVVVFPRKSVLNVVLLGGRDARIFFDRFFHYITDYARDIGCTEVQAGCGRAQTRLFQHYLPDARQVYSVLRLTV
jgi:hypothetical protein